MSKQIDTLLKCKLGKALATMRKDKGLRRYDVHLSTLIRRKVILDIEEARSSYQIDNLIRYIVAVNPTMLDKFLLFLKHYKKFEEYLQNIDKNNSKKG